MTKEDIIRMALEAGIPSWDDHEPLTEEHLLRFAALVAAHEREACADLADKVGDRNKDYHAWDAAEAIRARGSND
jgi:hypothetical protein